jgi:hypothetical protein
MDKAFDRGLAEFRHKTGGLTDEQVAAQVDVLVEQTRAKIPRIKVNEGDARYLYQLLSADRLAALAERRWAIEAGLDPLTFQQQTGRAQRIRREIEHLAAHMGWSISEPVREES